MFQIGEFSRIARVTIDTLRHYGALGLLKPAKVDPGTGYRYYTAEQLQTLNRIIALKEVGLSLEQVGRILSDHLTVDELRGMLKAQLVMAESEIETAKMRWERIRSRLNSLALEENLSAYEVTLKSIDALTVAAIRETIPTVEQVPQRLGEMFNTLAAWIKANNLPMGPPMTIYHDESYIPENIDTECAFIIPVTEIEEVVGPGGTIVIRQLKALPHAACTVITDDFLQKAEGLKPAYGAIVQWIEDHGFFIAGAPRELYYGTPEQEDFTAEIQFPVERCD